MTSSTNTDHELAIRIGQLHMNAETKHKTELEKQMDAIRAEEKRKDDETLAMLQAARQQLDNKINEIKRKYSSD